MSQLYGIVDCARDPRLYDWVQASPEKTCLYAGELSDRMARASPHLVRLDQDMPFTRNWRNEGWGKAWGILCRSDLEIVRLRRHLKKFLTAELPTGEKVIFRFYDPRVWRVYWSTLDDEERSKWLDGVESFTAEPE
jgi:hypothetical protein